MGVQHQRVVRDVIRFTLSSICDFDFDFAAFRAGYLMLRPTKPLVCFYEPKTAVAFFDVFMPRSRSSTARIRRTRDTGTQFAMEKAGWPKVNLDGFRGGVCIREDTPHACSGKLSSQCLRRCPAPALLSENVTCRDESRLDNEACWRGRAGKLLHSTALILSRGQ